MFMLRPKVLRGIFYFMEVTMDDKILKLKQDLENELGKIHNLVELDKVKTNKEFRKALHPFNYE